MLGGNSMERLVPIGISNRHIHLTQEHVEVLFGKGHQLTLLKNISQPGQFACEEKVDLVGSKGTVKGIRVLGPVREKTQVEISIGDSFSLGVKAPIRDSGDIEGSPGVKIIGPKGEVELAKGVIIAARHIHMSLEDAKKLNLEDKDVVNVLTTGYRATMFMNVLVRVSEDYKLEMHIDIEEGNAAGLKNGQLVKIHERVPKNDALDIYVEMEDENLLNV